MNQNFAQQPPQQLLQPHQASNPVIINKPIIYGSIASLLPKNQLVENATHIWKIFVRPYDLSSCLSTWIKEVQFILHESFPNHIRTVSKPPFVLEETGWGEFDLQIKLIFFTGENLTLYHRLRLFPDVKASRPQKHSKKPCIYEHYDEVLIQNPSQEFLTLLNKQVPSSPVYEQNYLAAANNELNSYIARRDDALRQALKLCVARQHVMSSLLLLSDLQEQAFTLSEQYMADHPHGLAENR